MKTYQCFVCGEQFNCFNQFKQHIVNNHEELREYLICPVSYCQAPVRDLKAHYQCKHPNFDLPTNMPSRAIIWKDISVKNGFKNTIKKPHFYDGNMFSNKNNKEIHYRSHMEQKVFNLLEQWQEVQSYEVEPFAIKYQFLGKNHNYLPDIKVNYCDGTVEVWEIKPSSQTQYAKNKAKWAACHQHCLTRGWKFMVLTEKGINKLNNKVKNNINLPL